MPKKTRVTYFFILPTEDDTPLRVGYNNWNDDVVFEDEDLRRVDQEKALAHLGMTLQEVRVLIDQCERQHG